MEKPNAYKWQETNLALFGSDIEKKIKSASAGCEKAWDGVGGKPEMRVWRIEKFKVVPWPKSKYGSFYDGDSYIVLHCYKKRSTGDALAWDIYFWIGANSSQDEYGTAAYKTVELDHQLKDMAVQHREVMDNESTQFLNLFDSIKYLQGGIESGFNHVEDEVFDPTLYHIKGNKQVMLLRQVKMRRDNLNSGDVFVLDLGQTIYQWNGREANPSEKLKARSFLDGIVSQRGGGTKAITLDEGGSDNVPEFWNAIPGERRILGIKVKEYQVKESDDDDSRVKEFKKVLFKLSDASGSMKFQQKAKANKQNYVNRRFLDTKDCFILDDGFTVWVWIGKGASSSERGLGMSYAMKYIQNKRRPTAIPIKRVTEGNEPPTFTEQFNFEESKCSIL